MRIFETTAQDSMLEEYLDKVSLDLRDQFMFEVQDVSEQTAFAALLTHLTSHEATESIGSVFDDLKRNTCQALTQDLKSYVAECTWERHPETSLSYQGIL